MKKLAILSVLIIVLALMSTSLVVAYGHTTRDRSASGCVGNVYLQQIRKNVPCYMVDDYMGEGTPKRVIKTMNSGSGIKSNAMTGTMTGSTKVFSKKPKTTRDTLEVKSETSRSANYEVRIRQGRGVNYLPYKYMNRDDLIEAFDLVGKEVYVPSQGRMVKAESLSRNRLLGALKHPRGMAMTFGEENVDETYAKLEELGVKIGQGSSYYAQSQKRTAPKRDSYRGLEVRKYFEPDRGSIVSSVQSETDTVK